MQGAGGGLWLISMSSTNQPTNQPPTNKQTNCATPDPAPTNQPSYCWPPACAQNFWLSPEPSPRQPAAGQWYECDVTEDRAAPAPQQQPGRQTATAAAGTGTAAAAGGSRGAGTRAWAGAGGASGSQCSLYDVDCIWGRYGVKWDSSANQGVCV